MSSGKSPMVVDDAPDVILMVPEYVKNRRKQKYIGVFFCAGLILSIYLGLMAYGLRNGFFGCWNHCPTAPTTTEASVPKPCERRIVGYFDLNYYETLTDLQLSLMTHIIVIQMTIDSDQHREKFKKLVETAKNNHVKVMISSAETWGIYRISDGEKRKEFINFIMAKITEYQLDGFDFAWKWPDTESDYQNLIMLVKELREAFNQYSKPLILSQLVAGQPKNSKLQNEASNYIDFLNVIADNHYGVRIPYRSHLVGPGAPLYSGHGNNYNENVDSTMRRFSCWTRSPNKLNMLIAADGRYWKNVVNSTSETLWMTAEPVNGRIQGGTHWWRNLKDRGWDVSKAMWNDETKTPYIWNPDSQSYLAFENEQSLREKVKYAIDKNIGGITFWDVHGDDDNASLLKVISTAKLCSGEDNSAVKYNCDNVHIY